MPRKFLVASAIILVCAILIIYHPGLSVGFMGDDWDFLRAAIQTPAFESVAHAFDPLRQIMWYRPMIGTLWEVDYILFGINAVGYHAVGIIVHLANCLLLLTIVKRLSHKLRVGFIAAVVYAGLALPSEAILWPSDPQIMATFFSMLALLFWIIYLERAQKRHFVLAWLFFALGLLSKESSITLVIVLVLADRLLIQKPVTWTQLFKRYTPFGLSIIIYLGLALRNLTQGLFPKQMGYSLGAHILYNLMDYLALLVLPWKTDSPSAQVWLVIVVLLFAWFLYRQSSRVLIFLGLAASVSLATVLPFPRTNSGYEYLNPRYTYLPLMASATLLALIVEAVGQRIKRERSWSALPALLTLLVIVNGWNTAAAAGFWAEASRVERIPFRNIATRHPTFPQDTFLYFIDAFANAWSTMFLTRYGANVSVSDIFTATEAKLRDHQNPIILYMDDQGNSQEIAVDRTVSTTTSLSLPLAFDASIKLEGYELASARVRRGDTVALILYWMASQKVDKDYTVFVHLIDAQGQMVEGHDSQPRDGKTATSRWPPNELNPDGILIHIPADTPVGNNYYLEIGLYDLPTLQRLSVLDAQGTPLTDKIIISPIQIIE